MDVSTNPRQWSKEAMEDTWWFICTLCNRAFTVNSQLAELQEHKWKEHGSRHVDNLLLLSQSISLEPKLRVERCSAVRRTLDRSSSPPKPEKKNHRPSGTIHNLVGGGDVIKRELEEVLIEDDEEPSDDHSWSCPPSPQLSELSSTNEDAEDPDYIHDSDQEEEQVPVKLPKLERETTAEGQPKCPTCGRTFSARKALKAHLENVHVPKIKCPRCKIMLAGPLQLRKHLRRLHPKELPARRVKAKEALLALHCPHASECGRTKPFKRRAELRSHLNHLHNPNRIASHVCPVCSRSFFKAASLRSHKETHGERTHMCPECGILFKTEMTLQLHQKSLHSDERPFACDKCPLRFKLKQRLVLHAAHHAEEATFICSQCPKAYKCKRDLRMHTKRVHETQIRSCRVCALEFKGILSLYRHELEAHNFQRTKTSYECKHGGCGAKFPTKFTFRNHLASHTEERRLKCPDCDKEFKTNANLRQHSVSHVPYDQLPHVCEVCGKRSGFPGHLREHRLRVHGIQ